MRETASTNTPSARANPISGLHHALIHGGSIGHEIVGFTHGTHIRTPTGDVPVEKLQLGDLVVTATGEAMDVRWLGRATMQTRFTDMTRAAPVRISAGALAPGLPVRDLRVSPDHALYLGGLLVQAAALINGTTIRRESPLPEQFTYCHVELERHTLLISEGVTTESFVSNVNRMKFDNWSAHPELSAHIPHMALPRAKFARHVPHHVHAMLAARAVTVA